MYMMSKSEWRLMLGVAGVFDLLGLIGAIIYLNFLVNIIAIGTFSLWFYLKGKKFIGRTVITSIIEFVPLLGALPGWMTMIAVSWAKDTVEQKFEGVGKFRAQDLKESYDQVNQ